MGRIHDLRTASHGFKIPEMLMVVAGRASDPNSLPNTDQVSLLTK